MLVRNSSVLSFYFFCFFVFFIPSSEALKNVFLFLFIFFAFLNMSEKGWVSCRVDIWDIFVFIFFGLLLLSLVLSGAGLSEWREGGDNFRFLLVFFLARRTFDSWFKVLLSIYFFIAGLAVALVFSLVAFYAGYDQGLLNFMSVGGENISGVYLAISLVFLMSLIYFGKSRLDSVSYGLLFIVFLVFLALWGTGSTAAIIAGFSVVLLISFVKSNNKVSLFFIMGGISSLVVLCFSVLPKSYLKLVDEVVYKVESIGEGRFLEARRNIWRGYCIIYSSSPVFGVGKGNHNSYDYERLLLLADNMDMQSMVPDSRYSYFFRPGRVTHSHNLYLQNLVDYGLLGLLSIVVLLLGMILAFFRNLGRGSSDFLSYALLGSVIIVMVTGITTVSFHHEVLLIVAVFFALSVPRSHANNIV